MDFTPLTVRSLPEVRPLADHLSAKAMLRLLQCFAALEKLKCPTESLDPAPLYLPRPFIRSSVGADRQPTQPLLGLARLP